MRTCFDHPFDSFSHAVAWYIRHVKEKRSFLASTNRPARIPIAGYLHLELKDRDANEVLT